MGAATVYSIDVLYNLRGVDNAVRQLDNAGAHAQKTERSFLSLRNVFLGAFAYRGIGLIKSGLIDTNAEMQNLQIGMSAVIAMNIGKPFQEARPYAAALIKDFREFARTAPGTTMDYIKFSQQIMGAVTSRGGSLRDVSELSKGGVVAAMALGQDPGYAARDIMQATMGGAVSANRDRFAAMLIQPYMDLDKFNKMKVPERIAFLKKALTSPAIKAATKEYGNSWEGVTSTLKDHWQTALRAVGGPLFAKLTQRLKDLNVWIETHPQKIKEITDAIGSGLARAADALFSAGKWIVTNRGLLMDVAKAYIAFRVISGVGGMGSNLMSNLDTFAGKLNLAALAAGGVAAALILLAPALGKLLDKVGGTSIVESGQRASWANKYDSHFSAYARVWDKDKVRGMFAEQGKASLGAVFGIGGALHGTVQDLLSLRQKDDPMGAHGKIRANRGTVNVTIKKVEVVADDSDNFVHDLVGAVGREITSPAQGLNMPRSVW